MPASGVLCGGRYADHHFAAREFGDGVSDHLDCAQFHVAGRGSGSDSDKLTAGTTVRLARNLIGLVAVTGALTQQSATAYGAQVGVNASF